MKTTATGSNWPKLLSCIQVVFSSTGRRAPSLDGTALGKRLFFLFFPLFIFKWEKASGCVAEEEATVKSNMDELCRRRPAMTQRAKVVGTIRMLFFCSSALLLVSVFYTDALAS
jgi:hypothetical protein